MAQSNANPPIRIRSQASSVRGANRTYSCDVQIGRKETCDVQVESGVVSRVHAEVVRRDGHWWVVDKGSTNGTYLNGESINEAPLPVEAALQLGKEGPTFQLLRPAAERPETSTSEQTEGSLSPTTGSTHPEVSSSTNSGNGGGRNPTPEQISSRPDASVTQYVQRYFKADGEEAAGEHTRLLRQAYQRAQNQERRRYVWIIASVLSLCVVLSGYLVWQHYQIKSYRQEARKILAQQRKLDAKIAGLEQREDTSKQLSDLRERRRASEKRYEGFVQELGIRRNLSPEEEEIYQVARIFGESEIGIPAGFVRKVKEKIETYWKSPEGRSRLVSAIQRAEGEEYTRFIVKTMREYSLPPEFFYLALQESDFDVTKAGPKTDWGVAKGMWQFIPKTAREYDLRLGPRKEEQVFDPKDERHNFKKSTRAAARYLRDIYSTKAQASGLLVIASYNWGEHRVTNKLDDLPKGIPDRALRNIPEDPKKRNYWHFLKNYSDRIPDQTKDYVLKVFSAAVIGHNPDRFGFDFKNPLRDHMGRLTALNSEGLSQNYSAVDNQRDDQ